MAAAIAALVQLWPMRFPDDPQRVITVYWTHECGCAAPWMRQLRDAGYEVRDFEQDSLIWRRRALRVPASIHGCHTAAYLGYFVEGHVEPAILQRLFAERPAAAGISYIPTAQAAGAEALRLYSDRGDSRRWQ